MFWAAAMGCALHGCLVPEQPAAATYQTPIKARVDASL